MKLIRLLFDRLRRPGRPVGDERCDPLWPKVRAEHLEAQPACAVCGSVKDLEVHHIFPFHKYPEWELSPENLITLCESRKWVNCHLFFGHLGDYHNFNPHVREDAKLFADRLKVFGHLS